MRLRFWGVRGGVPAAGLETAGVGGNTPCVELRSNEGDLIILDAGSGLRALGIALTPDTPRRVVATILISQQHLDHIQGLPFFTPARQRGNRFVIIVQKGKGQVVEQFLSPDIADTYDPAAPGHIGADVLVKEIYEGEPIVVGRSVVVRARQVSPPRGGFAYRISADGQVVSYVTDMRHPDGDIDRGVLEVAQAADLLIHDAQLTPEEHRQYPHWPHSSWDDAARVAKLVEARRLALFHHSPEASDEALMRVERMAQGIFPNSFLACEGLEIDLAVPPVAVSPPPEEEDSEEKTALREAAKRIMRKLREEEEVGG